MCNIKYDKLNNQIFIRLQDIFFLQAIIIFRIQIYQKNKSSDFQSLFFPVA